DGAATGAGASTAAGGVTMMRAGPASDGAPRAGDGARDGMPGNPGGPAVSPMPKPPTSGWAMVLVYTKPKRAWRRAGLNWVASDAGFFGTSHTTRRPPREEAASDPSGFTPSSGSGREKRKPCG